MIAINEPVHVIYHDNCMDGFGAAWAVYRHYQDVKDITGRGVRAMYHPTQHGDPVPDTTPDGQVYILDFSFSKEQMLELLDRHDGRVVLLDHHKTAHAELRGVENCIFDMNKSGASMAWEYFQNQSGNEMPQLIRYIEDRGFVEVGTAGFQRDKCGFGHSTQRV